MRRLPKVRARFRDWAGAFGVDETGEVGGEALSFSARPPWRSVGVRAEAWEKWREADVKERWSEQTGSVISLDNASLLGTSQVSGNWS